MFKAKEPKVWEDWAYKRERQQETPGDEPRGEEEGERPTATQVTV